MKYVFWFLFWLYIAMNLDHGAIPASIIDIRRELNLTDVQVGNFGSLVFLGLGIGSFLCSLIIGKISYRHMIIFAFIGNAVGQLMFGIQDNYLAQCISRFASGLCQCGIFVYVPLFIDTHGDKDAPQWMSYMLLAPPFGVMIGYFLTATCLWNDLTWRNSFQI